MILSETVHSDFMTGHDRPKNMRFRYGVCRKEGVGSIFYHFSILPDHDPKHIQTWFYHVLSVDWNPCGQISAPWKPPIVGFWARPFWNSDFKEQISDGAATPRCSFWWCCSWASFICLACSSPNYWMARTNHQAVETGCSHQISNRWHSRSYSWKYRQF